MHWRGRNARKGRKKNTPRTSKRERKRMQGERTVKVRENNDADPEKPRLSQH